MLVGECVLAAVLLRTPASPPVPSVPGATAVPSATASVAPPSGLITTMPLPDARTARLIALGGPRSGPLLERIGAELAGASVAVTDFWGPDWRRDIEIAAAGSDQEFEVLAAGAPDIAATTTDERIMFAPGADAMSPEALRIVLRHELFHYAARPRTAADAPRWLTEGVADYVGRPATPRPEPRHAVELARLPSDTDLDTPGATRSLAYDRAWWFSRYVAETHGPAALRELYHRACGPGHSDVATAVRQTLSADLDEVVADWRRWMTG